MKKRKAAASRKLSGAVTSIADLSSGELIDGALASRALAETQARTAIDRLLEEIAERRKLIHDLGGADPFASNGNGRKSSGTRKEYVCTMCGQPGHNSRKCPKKTAAGV